MMNLSTLSDTVNGQLKGADVRFEKVVTDSRRISGSALAFYF